MFSINWLISDTLELDDTFKDDYDDDFFSNNNNDNEYIKRQYPLTIKRYLTMTAEKYLWNKLMNEMKTGGLQKLMHPRVPTALRFG
ncbi:unnamed protein product [Schistosoma mattheei]|uniref:Uncharacterized protein n=1 Tax=Schistosoma mattheei TaxID=31246 RepID=A0AA85B479_9TREM|nr:unnamed protein product [Schistosoma mattheei]